MTYLNKSAEEILELIGKQQSHNTLLGEQYSAAITVRVSRDIETALNNLKDTIADSAEKSDKFSNRIYFLNWVLTIATAVGAIATVLLAIK